MKKLSLVIAALALVIGISQCKKQEAPAANGQKQHIVLTADNGNDGSKVSADFVSANLNLTWDGNEVITVSGGATGTLGKITVDQSNPSKATFEGDIEITDESELLEFTVGDTPNYEGQPGTEDGCEGWIKNNISLTGTDGYDLQGQYSADMKLPYAVLKLDVSALGTSGKLEIKVGETLVASVTDVSTLAAVFVAVPTDGSEKEYKISIGGKTATKKWSLQPNTFYTKSNGAGGGTGDAIVIPATPKFTVGMDGDKPITVEFAPGNLWYGKADGEETAAFHFEDNQTAYTTEWKENHVDRFFWSNTTDWQTSGKEPYASSYSYSTQTMSDVFFTEAEGFKVGNEAGWRTLSNGEWAYLLNTSGSSGRTDASRFAKAMVNDVCGLLIFPDNYSGTASGTGIADVNATEDVEFPTSSISDDTWKAMESAGAVFLPAAGLRLGTGVDYAGSEGYYWSSTPHNSMKSNAYYMRFNSQDVYTNSRSRNRNGGLSVRLVRDVK